MVIKQFALGAFMMAALAGAGSQAAAQAATQAGPSYLFGGGARAAFGPTDRTNLTRYTNELAHQRTMGFQPVSNEFGTEQPTELRILIKDAWANTPQSRRFVVTLAYEKANLMKLYGLSNREYNRLAAMAFGILGRETRFGRSPKYMFKEKAQFAITFLKQIRERSLEVAENSRGLTQIKVVPDKIRDYYCIEKESDLQRGATAAVATMGFLAESLEYTKHRAKKLNLSYINDENIYDYIMYVYFGSMRQLVNPQFNRTGRTVYIPIDVPRERYRIVPPGGQLNEIATPSRNIYLQTVKSHLRQITLVEKPRTALASGRVSTCRSSASVQR